MFEKLKRVLCFRTPHLTFLAKVIVLKLNFWQESLPALVMTSPRHHLNYESIFLSTLVFIIGERNMRLDRK